MKNLIACLFLAVPVVFFPQSKQANSVLSPKPGISVNGNTCLIQNTIWSCMTKTCDSVTINQGDSIEFCTYQEIFLDTDSAYYMRWDFNGSSNYPSSVYDSFPTTTPVCYLPEWNTPGNYVIDVYYNGWLTAYPNSDCYSYGPSHWVINVSVQTSMGLSAMNPENIITIYPNPSTGVFNLECNYNHQRDRVFRVCTYLGETLFTSTIQNPTSSFDLRSYPKGLYFIKVDTETGTIVKMIVRS